MTLLPRLQLFELHEQPWVPATLRADLQIGLSAMVQTMHFYRKVMVRIQQWLRRAQVEEILDLCSGAGGPAQTLVESCLSSGEGAPRVWLSDLYPSIDAFQTACEKYPEHLGYLCDPIDATDLCSRTDGIAYDAKGTIRARSLIACFHQFSPNTATQILREAMEQRAPILILEPIHRSGFALCNAIFGAGVLIPLLRLLQRPFAPGAFARLPLSAGQSLFDGLVSVLRTYTPEEMARMVDLPDSDYDWDIGCENSIELAGVGLHKVTYALGTPRERLT